MAELEACWRWPYAFSAPGSAVVGSSKTAAPPQMIKRRRHPSGGAAAVLRVRSRLDLHQVGIVLLDVCVAGDQHQTFDPCLGDEHAVDRVAVDQREVSGFDGVSGCDGQLAEAAVPDAVREIQRLGKLSDSPFDGDFELLIRRCLTSALACRYRLERGA